MQDGTEVRPVPLRFFLGELRIAEVTRRLAVVPFAFNAAELGAEDWPRGPAPAGAEGFYHPSARIAGNLPKVARNGRFIRYVPARFRRHYIDLGGSMDDYLATFSGKTRNTLRRKIKKFAEASGGEIAWRTYATPDEMAEFHRLAREISAKTYQERLLDAGLPESDDFRAEMMARAARGLARGHLLFLQGKPISYLYLPVEDDRLIYAYLGYDPEHAKLSPGTVLQWLVVEALYAERRFRYFDFTEGQGAHKELFGTNSLFCGNVYFLEDTFRNRLTVALHRGLTALSDGIVRILDRLGVKQAIKKWLRARA